MNFPSSTLPFTPKGTKRIFLMLLLIGMAHGAFCQKGIEKNGLSFRIQKVGNTYTPETVIQTFENADLRFHRFQSASNVLVLDDFTEVEIRSAETLLAQGYPVEVANFRTAYPATYQTPVFRINRYILLEQRITRSPDK